MKALIIKMDAKTDEIVYERARGVIEHPSCESFRIVSLENTEQCTRGSIREEVACFIDRTPVFTKLRGVSYYETEDALTDFIINILGGK